MIKNPNWQEATSWLFTSVAEDLNSGRPRTNPASGHSGTRTRDRGIASPTRWTLGHAASSKFHRERKGLMKMINTPNDRSFTEYISQSRFNDDVVIKLPWKKRPRLLYNSAVLFSHVQHEPAVLCRLRIVPEADFVSTPKEKVRSFCYLTASCRV